MAATKKTETTGGGTALVDKPQSDGGNGSSTMKRKPVHSVDLGGGISFAVWVNKDRDGNLYRTITFRTRRYKDPNTDEWKDGPLREGDLGPVEMAVRDVKRYCQDHPLNSDAVEAEYAAAEYHNGGEVPF